MRGLPTTGAFTQTSVSSRAPLPKFVIPRSNLWRELRKQRSTSNLMILVPLSDLTFLSEFAAHGVGTSRLRPKRRRATLAGNHGRAQQERSRTFPVRRHLTQFVEVVLAHLRIACLETFLVGDRLLLHKFDRDGAPL